MLSQLDQQTTRQLSGAIHGANAMRYRTVIVLLAIAIPVLSLWSMQIARSGWCNDEAAHIPSGLYHLATGRMDAYHVNPPLPRMIAALPLLIDRPMIKWHHSDSPYVRLKYQLAEEWVNENQSSLRRQLILARSTTIFFFGLGIWSIVRWTYRYIGNPFLSGVGHILFEGSIRDFHCGLRGFRRDVFEQLKLSSTGMEFASEMLIRAEIVGLRTAEVPVSLRPDGRDRPPHLRCWRDGWRHLILLLQLAPQGSLYRHTLGRMASRLTPRQNHYNGM
ncbi:hypothetical protein Poly21_15040 [Allorhodopirellula heiligendammensis]|uniref:Uncharacterized protein n=1 Tax=Allorhodopirellula heiligendammensis TaxID=2714739 RepID=A0A5C6C5I7_9BACT|nr:hypothetical protein Poly21_15040 [Allorhodopirellula heiligendammensis]